MVISKIIAGVLISWIVLICVIAYCRVGCLIKLMLSEQTPPWFPDDAIDIVQNKRSCRDYTTTIIKMIVTPCETGYPTWSTFIHQLIIETKRLPAVDCIIGVTSGGWLIAQIFARVLGKKCIKIAYSRYSKKKAFEKTLTYIRGHKTAHVSPDWTTNDHMIVMSEAPTYLENKVCLLVDDSIGSGATLHVCREYLSGCNPDQVYTYVCCATKPEMVDFYSSTKHFIVFPWGLDV